MSDHKSRSASSQRSQSGHDLASLEKLTAVLPSLN